MDIFYVVADFLEFHEMIKMIRVCRGIKEIITKKIMTDVKLCTITTWTGSYSAKYCEQNRCHFIRNLSLAFKCDPLDICAQLNYHEFRKYTGRNYRFDYNTIYKLFVGSSCFFVSTNNIFRNNTIIFSYSSTKKYNRVIVDLTQKIAIVEYFKKKCMYDFIKFGQHTINDTHVHIDDRKFNASVVYYTGQRSKLKPGRFYVKHGYYFGDDYMLTKLSGSSKVMFPKEFLKK